MGNLVVGELGCSSADDVDVHRRRGSGDVEEEVFKEVRLGEEMGLDGTEGDRRGSW